MATEQVTEIPDCADKFKVGDKSFELDAFALYMEMIGVSEANVTAGKPHLTTLRHLASEVEARCGVTLRDGQADWLLDELARLQVQKKSERESVMSALANSLHSTVSARSG